MKKYLLVWLALLAGHTAALAQRPSERRQKAQVAESAQQEFDPFFTTKDVPTEYSNESAIVLAQKSHYSFTTNNQFLLITENNRRRIKLLDKAAVNTFSEFYFSSADGKGFQITLEKPNGKKTNLNANDAVKVTTAVPEFYRSGYNSKDWSYYKVAVPNLEPGDILDYSSQMTETRVNYDGSAQCFAPVIYTTNGTYTVLKQKLSFKVEKGYYVNIKSGKGAPEVTKSPDDPSDRRHVSYTFENGVSPRVNSSLWVYKLQELPHVKFQVCYSQIGKEENTFQFLGKPNEPKQKVTLDEIVEKVNKKYATTYRSLQTSLSTKALVKTLQFMRTKHRQLNDPEKYARIAYYSLRNNLLVEPGNLSSIRDDYFAMMLMTVLDDKKIPFELLVGTPRHLGTIENTIFYDELTWFLKIGSQYVFNPDTEAVYGEPDITLMGTKALQITLARNKNEQKYKMVTVPSSPATENTVKIALQVNLDKDLEKMEVKSSTKATGLYKYVLYGTALPYTDYLDQDYLSFGGTKSEQTDQTRNKARLAEIERKKKAGEAENATKKVELMKASLQEEFKNVLTYDDFKLIKDGRSDQNKELEYNERFTLGDLVKKAGPNYILELGTLIGSQVEVLDQEKERKFDVNMNYAKSIRHQITVAIPDGYKVDGLNDLNFKIDNAAGSFISSSRMENNQLVINTEKTYKHEYQKKESWPQMLEFLDAAYAFTQKKVVLKKGI